MAANGLDEWQLPITGTRLTDNTYSDYTPPNSKETNVVCEPRTYGPGTNSTSTTAVGESRFRNLFQKRSESRPSPQRSYCTGGCVLSVLFTVRPESFFDEESLDRYVLSPSSTRKPWTDTTLLRRGDPGPTRPESYPTDSNLATNLLLRPIPSTCTTL